ncbi:carboxypeptidase regulatory-like domain-containing protein [Pedobacter nototheniae]|uniref:carboxypeptidase regulatory-like domain-containing protein n=1 Tax=Pedobacter nototheniae TaxID=2488994 RepID=UPI00292F6E73|nr:carboxypeptidase regulatory-like domain-containing protein [Pedobacter nototheniae]
MNNDWLDIDVLEDYLDGKLDAKAMHFVERQELEDPFVAEALEGLRQSPKRKQTYSILQKQLHDRIAIKPVKRRLWGITTQRLSIAATATVAFITVSILFFMREINHRNEVAQRKANGVIVNLDTNTAIAANKPKAEDISADKTETAQSALIDKAVKDAKTGDLAKNIRSSNHPVAADLPAPTSRKKVEVVAVDDKRSFSVQEARVAAAPAIVSNSAVYSGTVNAEGNGLPISGAIVKVAGTKSETKTDANGNFYLPVDSSLKNRELVVRAEGYKDAEISKANDPNTIRIALRGDLSLNEIAAVTGSNGRERKSIPAGKVVLKANPSLDAKSSKEITVPVPVSTVNYEAYLENNNKLYNPKGPEQYVTVSFKVRKSGRPGSVKILKGLNNEADAEAKRLVENGPDWVLPKNGNDTVELTIKF